MQRKVLVIDDSPLIHDVLAVRLGGDAMAVHSAMNGPDGIRMAMEIQPDLILLDVDLAAAPDGYEVCRQLKTLAQTMNIQVIFLSGAASTDDKIKGLNLGAVDYITKPFEAAELQARVGAALRTRRLLELLERKAMIDGLSGLWNRTYLNQQVESLLALSARSGSTWTCLMIDIDHFKAVNDTHGHLIGDSVLQHVAAIVSDACRQQDVVCRYGGEEFAVLLPETPLAGAEILAERIRAAVECEAIEHGSVVLKVTCSIGLAEHVAKRDGRNSPIPRADGALYQAKQSGRNRCVAAAAPAQQKIIAA